VGVERALGKREKGIRKEKGKVAKGMRWIRTITGEDHHSEKGPSGTSNPWERR